MIHTNFRKGTDDMARFWQIFGGVVALLALVVVIYRLARLPSQHPFDQYEPAVKAVLWDQKVYEWEWQNWTVADWVFTLLAAGTAITAAVKNAFSSHAQSQAALTEEELNKLSDTDKAAVIKKVVESSSRGNAVDKWVMAFAGLTVVATTLNAKLQAGTQADRYRRGDLILQSARMDYLSNNDTKALLASWHQAQRVLEGVPERYGDAGQHNEDNGGNVPNPASSDQTPSAAPPSASPAKK
jgi:hypothetical protein